MPVVQNERGYTVSKKWLEKVDGVVATVSAPKTAATYGNLWQIFRVVYIVDEWTLETGAYKSRGRFVNDNGAVVNSTPFPLYFPLYLASSRPSKNSRVWAVNRGKKWEVVTTPTSSTTYEAGAGIALNPSWTGNVAIENIGVVNVKVPDNSYTDTGTLYFNKNQFQWLNSSLDITGKKEIGVKTTYKQAVGAITGGEITRGSFVLPIITTRQIGVVTGINSDGTPVYTVIDIIDNITYSTVFVVTNITDFSTTPVGINGVG